MLLLKDKVKVNDHFSQGQAEPMTQGCWAVWQFLMTTSTKDFDSRMFDIWRADGFGCLLYFQPEMRKFIFFNYKIFFHLPDPVSLDPVACCCCI